MKKFFSLVLALVMALSLTTVAWGATDALQDAIAAGETNIVLTAGNYTMPQNNVLQGKTVTISGPREAVIDISAVVTNGSQAFMGTTLVFDGVTIKGSTSARYMGFTHAASLTYKNCKLTGLQTLYADTVVFDNCEFDSTANTVEPHAVWTWSAKNVTFTDCKFTYGDRAINVFGEHDVAGGQTVTFEECTFITNDPDSEGAVEINGSGITSGVDVSLDDCTAPANGELAYVSRWDSTGGANTDVFVDDALVGGVAEVGGTQYKSLTDALKAVSAINNTIVLLDDITITQDWDCRIPAKGGVGATFTVPVTIDGDGKTLKFTGKINDGYNHFCAFRFEADATVKNLTIDMSEAHAVFQNRFRAISAMANLTVDKCNFIGNPVYTNTRAIIFGESAGADISDVKVSVTNSTFKDWTYGLTDNENGKDVESVTVTGNKFTDSSVQLSASETVAFNNNTVDDGKVTITSYSVPNELAVTATGNTLDADEVNKIKAETITTDTNDFAATGALVAPAGYSVVNGKIVAKSSLKGNTITLDVDDLTVTDKLGADVPTTSVTGITKYAASTSTTTVNGKTTTKVVPTWFLLSEGAYNYTFVECDKACADFLFAIKGVGSFYVRAMDVPAAFDSTPVTLYTAPKTATCDKVGQDNDVYVVADGKYYATDSSVVAGAEKYALLSNGKMVVYYGEATAKPHNWAQATKQSFDTKTGVITSVKCPDCKGVVAVYKNAGVFDGKVYKQITVGVAKNYYYVAGTAANTITGTIVGVPSTPSTDKVTSADTFDAGIALYVGMSVMAAAGSVVVLKKRED